MSPSLAPAPKQDGTALRQGAALAPKQGTGPQSAPQAGPQAGPQSAPAPKLPAAVPGATARPGSRSLVPTIFHENWWLQAASAGRWQEVDVQSGGRTIGRFPFMLERRLGYTTIGMPMLTHFLGPALDDGEGTSTTRLLKRISITRDLIGRLPRAASLWMKCHRGVTDMVAFQGAGYRTDVQFTCEIAPAPEAKLWADVHPTERRAVRRASEQLEVIEEPDPGRFLAFYESNLAARGRNNNYDAAICRNIIAECQRRGAGRILIADDAAGRPNAAIFTIWDATTEYYLMSTRRLDAHCGATGLLIWAAIRHAAERQRTLDLDGISTFGDIQFLTRFGGVLMPRYIAHNVTLPFRIVSRTSDRMHHFFRPMLRAGRQWSGPHNQGMARARSTDLASSTPALS